MSTTLAVVPAKPVLALSNIKNGLASTLLGIAVAAPEIATAVSTFTLPTTPAGWLQIGLGALALFAKG